jgi:1-deoxy-D-xylulose-5-phosphate synthase
VPGLRLAAPRDVASLREQLDEAVDVDDAPTVVRFPKGPPPEDIPALDTLGTGHDRIDVLFRDGDEDVLVVAVGAMAATGIEVAERLRAQGIGVTVVDPRWVKPVNPLLVDLARAHARVVTIEDNGRVGGVGAVLLQTLSDAGLERPVQVHGIPQEFLDHAKRGVILDRIGLSAQAIALDVVHAITAGAEPALIDVDGPR